MRIVWVRDMPSTQPYRPDIDSLRAVTILCVVVFHAGYGPFSGGFVGVDVFFVISGFLITRLIRAELLNGTFSFGRFYVRRARRRPADIRTTVHRIHESRAARKALIRLPLCHYKEKRQSLNEFKAG